MSGCFGSSGFGMSGCFGSSGFGMSGCFGSSGFGMSGCFGSSGFGVSGFLGSSASVTSLTFTLIIKLPFSLGSFQAPLISLNDFPAPTLLSSIPNCGVPFPSPA